ncbi:hypothetical protein [Marinimicrobium agarilyticum]|uniref:hypothetical protein n=1 Tax=Marinimicrobium agarilyticum TaxID=306546 RepID=UPI0012F63D4F|nr:hypothetical protein [Marinimicrobium agarilyticum]
MDSNLKKALVRRMFSSTEYIEEMKLWVDKAGEQLSEAVRHFYRFPPQKEDWHNWHRSDWPETWEEKVLQTISSYSEGIKNAIQEHKKSGESALVDGWASTIYNIFRNMDVVGWKWWEYIPKNFREDFEVSLVKASKIGANITRELSGHWRHPDSVLDEEITGPVDEVELKRYLKPGESM